MSDSRISPEGWYEIRRVDDDVTPSRLELDPSHSPTQPPDMVETLRVVGWGSGMEQVNVQDGRYYLYLRYLTSWRFIATTSSMFAGAKKGSSGG